MKFKFYYFFLLFFLISCYNSNNKAVQKNPGTLTEVDTIRIKDSIIKVNKMKNINSVQLKLKSIDTSHFYDTIIYLHYGNEILSPDTIIKPPLTLLKVKEILYSYYKNLGYYLEKTPYSLGDSDKTGRFAKDGTSKFIIFFDTAMFVSLNNDNIYDAIVQYYISPPFACCHCCTDFPTKSIIISKKGKYCLTGFDFISKYFYIDSLKQISPTSLFIYGKYLDCQNWGINRHLKITLIDKENE